MNSGRPRGDLGCYESSRRGRYKPPRWREPSPAPTILEIAQLSSPNWSVGTTNALRVLREARDGGGGGAVGGCPDTWTLSAAGGSWLDSVTPPML